jgi:hypothetical protein
MNQHEMAVLDALNIASTIHQGRPIGFEATAKQIAEVLATDEQIIDDYRDHVRDQSTHEIAVRLSRMSGRGNRWLPFGPLCESHRKGYWRLTSEGARFLGA